MCKKKGFTLTELIAVISLISIIALIATPVFIGMIDNVKEKNRINKVKTYAKEVADIYLFKLAHDEFYKFDSEEKGGITTNNVINFTNEWLDENVYVGGVSCNGDDVYSNVFFNIYSESIELTNCVVDGISGYKYINNEVIKN